MESQNRVPCRAMGGDMKSQNGCCAVPCRVPRTHGVGVMVWVCRAMEVCIIIGQATRHKDGSVFKCLVLLALVCVFLNVTQNP